MHVYIIEKYIAIKNKKLIINKVLRIRIAVMKVNKFQQESSWVKAWPLKDFTLGSSPSVNRKFLTHPNKYKHTSTHSKLLVAKV